MLSTWGALPTHGVLSPQGVTGGAGPGASPGGPCWLPFLLLRPRPGLSGGGAGGLALTLVAVGHSLFSLHGFSWASPLRPAQGLSRVLFLVSERITWARRRQTGLISPGMPL